MHKKTAGLILGSAVLAIGVFSAFSFAEKKENIVTFATYTNGDAATYYNSIDDTKSGNDLLKDLRSLNLSKRQSTVGYSSMGTSPSGQFKYTDYDPNYVEYDNNGQPYGTRISSFYTYTSATNWNREHVWPNSHGGGSGGDAGSPYPDADIHMPRPTISSENSSRGNSFFVEGMNSSSSGWDPLTAGYSAESRGEAARITFYCTLVNSKLILAPNNTSPSGSDPVTGQSYGSGHTMGNLETLIKWNINYPVTQREKNRNEGAEYLQGNRNAFVDHPEYACKIWGNVNSNIRTMCQNASWDTPAGVSLDKTTLSMVVDGTATLAATSTDGSQISWSSSNSTVVDVNVATSNSGAAVTIEAIGPGTANIVASATISGNAYTARCAVTVSSSGGSGGDTPVSGDYSITTSDLNDNSYPTTATDYTAASGITFKAYNCANFSNKIQFKKSGGYIYSTQSLNLASIKINNPEGTLTVYGGSSQNPSGTAITGSNGIYNLSGYNYFKIINSSESVARCTGITISVASESDDPVLQSIEVSTPPTKLTYNVGEYFDPTGLVITRNYSDGTDDTYAYAGHASEFSFTPNTSTALTLDDSGITITYGGKDCEQEITVNPVPATSITATPDKTFYVGETITVADIIVKDNNNNTITDFTFANNDYQFTYADAASGGALTSKTFSNSITYGNLQCSLTVQVQRKAYENATAAVTDTITASDLTATGTSYTNFSNVSKPSGAKYAGNSAKNGNNIQMRSSNSNSGIVSTHSGGTISSVKITVASGTNTIQVYGKNTAYSSASDLYNSNQGTLVGSVSATGTVTFETAYTYVGIRSSGGAIYLSSIEINYGTAETAVNVANYIMYEDTNGQCSTKLNIAVGYLNNTSSTEFELFMNSDGYVLSTARTRLYAWAANQGKVISVSNNQITLSSAKIINGIGDVAHNSNTTMILIIVISLSLTTMAGLVIIKKKHKK